MVELSDRPWKLQLIVNGRSPSRTMQLTCATAPAVEASSSNANGVILGGANYRCIDLLIRQLFKKI
jgi:hypothetical protein